MSVQILGDFNTKSYKELVFNQNLHIEYYFVSPMIILKFPPRVTVLVAHGGHLL